jgi:hypothetical protein
LGKILEYSGLNTERILRRRECESMKTKDKSMENKGDKSMKDKEMEE